MKGYIYELQTRPDGITNVVAPEMRSNDKLAMSYFHERMSKAEASTQFTNVVLTCIREDGKILGHGAVETAYNV